MVRAWRILTYSFYRVLTGNYRAFDLSENRIAERGESYSQRIVSPNEAYMIYSRLTHEGRSSTKALKSLGSPCQTKREDLPAGK